MILIIDNYDSFVYNLARYVGLAGDEAMVVRNDRVSVEECIALDPDGVILSPGPKTPKEAGISLALLSSLPMTTPLLGVCLGHQCIAECFGGSTVRAIRPLHGEASAISHHGTGLFAGLPSPLMVGRYHSLVSVLPDQGCALTITARSDEGEIMALQHQTAPWFGVQFHPESVLTPQGQSLINAFIAFCRRSRAV